ncbi:MAG TPA: hypothetical protein VKT80_19275 [Chloroflexota bacterium]|nr:hypothetical protein [Chloroflexota bacterium]
MNLDFERGRAESPCGHALVYYTDPSGGATLATYIVVLPISLQLAKYIPPMLAAQLPMLDPGSTGAVPIPPLPEPVESRAYLERLADMRRDDLIAAGTLNPSDVGRAMALVAETTQLYAQLYENSLKQLSPGENATDDAESVSEMSANDAIHGLMSESQKLGELAKLAGQLRYAVDGSDQRQISELTREMSRLGQFLPSTYRVEEFIAAATRPGDAGRELAALYLDRCYKLAAEDYGGLAGVDRDIQRLRDLA